MIEIRKVITENEAWYGFLRIPGEFAKLLPIKKEKLSFIINSEVIELQYQPKYRKVYGLIKYYRKYNIITGTKMLIKKP